MRKFSKRETVIFGICVLMAAFYFINALAARPAKEREGLIDQKIELASVRLKKDAGIVRQKDAVEETYRQLFDRFGQKDSDATEGSQMLAALQDLAGQTSVHIANIQTQRVAAKEFYKQFTVQLVIDGSWPSILDFLYQIQNDPYYFTVEEINLEKNMSDSGSSLKGQLTVGSLRFSSLR